MQALSQQLSANDSTPEMELSLRNLQLKTDSAAMVVRLCDFLLSHSATGVVTNICEQLTPAIVTAINAFSLPNELEGLITYMEGAFPVLLDARTEKRMMKAELVRFLIHMDAENQDENSGNDENIFEPVTKVRPKILTKLQEASRQHAERQQRRAQEKKRAQAGLDDDDDDFAEVKKSPINLTAAAASTSSSKKKLKSRKRKTEVEHATDSKARLVTKSSGAPASRGGAGAKTAAQKRLNRAAADKTQQRLGFSSLSAANRDTQDDLIARRLKQSHPNEVYTLAQTRPTTGSVDTGTIEDTELPPKEISLASTEETGHRGVYPGGKRRSCAAVAEDSFTQQQPQSKRLRVVLRSGQAPFLECVSARTELRTGQNLLSLGGQDDGAVLAAGGVPELPEPTREFLAVYVSEHNDAVLMSSTSIGPEVSVFSKSQSASTHVKPHVPIILSNGDTIELHER